MTYTDLSQALFQFWSQFTWDGKPIKAWRQGHVPVNADLPYITYSVGQSPFGGASIKTAFVWCRHSPGSNVNAQRSTILDQVANAIPETGTVIQTHSGGMWLQRNVDFLSDYDPPNESADEGEPIIGGRISYIINCY